MKKKEYTPYRNMPVVEETVEVEKEEQQVAPVEKEVQVQKCKVVGCDMLNVRREPNGEVLEVVKKDDVMTIESFAKKDWIAVVTASGTAGFCMKEYIEVL